MNVSREQQWVNDVRETFERLRVAYALEGLGVHDDSGVNEVDVALGELGILEIRTPQALHDGELAVVFGIYHEIARGRLEARRR